MEYLMGSGVKMKNKNEVIEYINALKGYEGYTQFSHRPIDVTKDIFEKGKVIEVKDEEGFIYEAHFCNAEESISIRQLNDSWLVSTTDISDIPKEDIQTYHSINGIVKMAQVWEAREDELCEGMRVKKLRKVVFAGFVGGEA